VTDRNPAPLHQADPAAAPAARSPERERLLRRLAVLVSLLILFALAEVGLRVYARFSAYIPKVNLYDAPHAYLGRALIPGASFESRVAGIHVNARGFRGPEFAAPKPAGTYRIFALGGSTTFGYYPATTSDATAYPTVLQARLNTTRPLPGVERYEVVNAGVPGYSLRTSLQNFAGRVLFLQPDMVVVYHLTNDLARYGNEYNLNYPLLNQFVESGVVAGFLDGVMGWSWAFQELRFSLGTRLLGGLFASRGAPLRDDGDWRPDPRYLEAFRRDLRNLVVLAKANGVVPVLATQSIAFTAKTDFAKLTDDERRMQFDKPALFYATVPPTRRSELFQRYNDIIRDVARAEGAIFADVDAAIPKTPQYHWDYCHLTDAGSALQAETIHRAIGEAAPRSATR
jgi:lysophospholipase L1-like esterase